MARELGLGLLQRGSLCTVRAALRAIRVLTAAEGPAQGDVVVSPALGNLFTAVQHGVKSLGCFQDQATAAARAREAVPGARVWLRSDSGFTEIPNG